MCANHSKYTLAVRLAYNLEMSCVIHNVTQHLPSGGFCQPVRSWSWTTLLEEQAITA